MGDSEAPKGQDAPERIFVNWPNPNSTGLAFICQARPPAFRTEYTRADLLTAAQARAERAEADLREIIDAGIGKTGTEAAQAIGFAALRVWNRRAALREGGDNG